MTEQKQKRLRLTDAEVRAGYAGSPELPKGSLRSDHLQAREDVKRLSAMLRWARERDLFRSEDEEKDAEVSALLSEVGE